MTYTLAPFAIFLIGNTQCGMGGSKEFCEGCCIGYDGVVDAAEDDVFDSKSLGTGALLGWLVCVFTYPEEVVKGNANQVAQGLL